MPKEKAQYFSIDLKGKSKQFLALHAEIDDALQEAQRIINETGAKLIAQAKKDGVLTVPPGKIAKVVRNRFGGGLQIMIGEPSGSSTQSI